MHYYVLATEVNINLVATSPKKPPASPKKRFTDQKN
jgi:hypothetical protein